MNKRTTLIIIGVIGVVALVMALRLMSTYNSLVALGEGVESQWAQVENVYQRRADLVPNLVSTVKGAAAHERETFEAITRARAEVGSINIDASKLSDPAELQRFEAAQDALSSSMARLLVVAENYPQLRANENFLALQSQLEGTENRIAVERQRFNTTANAFNVARQSFPTVLIAGMLGDTFDKKVYFHAQSGAAKAPAVTFE